MSFSSASPCPRCERPGYLLPFLSKYAPVNYFRCDPCGYVWGFPKDETALVREVVNDGDQQKANA